MELNVYDNTGAVVRQLAAQDGVFDIPFARTAVHQSFVRQLANQRQGTSNTKTRGMVQGSTRKLFRQKGTGRARQGGARAPHRRGGGVAHGPHPRDYRLDMPKKMRRLALKSVLSAKARDGELFVLDSLDFAVPKTKQLMAVLAGLRVSGKTLLVVSGSPRNVVLSARNIPGLRTLPANLLNIADLIQHRNVIMTAEAIAEIERIWGTAETSDGAADIATGMETTEAATGTETADAAKVEG